MLRAILVVLVMLGGCSGPIPGYPPDTGERRAYCYQTKDKAPPVVVPCPSASLAEPDRAPGK